jgi:hypothetical protein
MVARPNHDADALLNDAASPTSTGRSLVASSRAATTRDDECLHGQQLPRIGTATKRPLHRRDNLPT